MYVIQIFVPLRDNDGTPFPRTMLDGLRRELTDRFGGVTAHVRAPASGAWKDEEGDVSRDDVVIVEVMADDLDRAWWSAFRSRLEDELSQAEILIRAMHCDRL